jgi:osmotically-inducible protein OsmY
MKRKNMKTFKTGLSLLAVVAAGTLVGCSTTSTKAADVAGNIRTSLDQAGLKDVSASQDRDKGVVTLGGHVATDDNKSQAESIAKSIAGPQVVANEIAVIPPGAEKDVRQINSDLDKGIESNLDAASQVAQIPNVPASIRSRAVRTSRNRLELRSRLPIA